MNKRTNKDLKNRAENNTEQALLRFLFKTKKGEYSLIDEESIKYSRLAEERENISGLEEEYYYSIS